MSNLKLFDKVKSFVTTQAYMEYFGEEGKQFAQGTRYNVCPACNLRSNLVFNAKSNGVCKCFSCGFSGSVIDVHAAYIGSDAVAAAIDLTNIFGLNDSEGAKKVVWQRPDPVVAKKVNEERQSALSESLHKLHLALIERLKATPDPTARRYLLNERCIPEDIVASAEKRRMVAYLPANPFEAQALLDQVLGRDLMERAGLMKPESKMAAIAFRPLVFFMPGDTSAEFRLLRAPKDKDEPKSIRYGDLQFPYWWQGESSETVEVVEGAIDLLSKVALGAKTTVMAIPGTQAWHCEWFNRIQRRHGTSNFVVALDGDTAGNNAFNQIANVLDEASIQYIRVLPSHSANDWNDVLKAKSKLPVAA